MGSGDAREHWEQQADAWVAFTRADPAYELHNKPTFLDLVPSPRGLAIDVGCGEGRLARELVALGHPVMAFDGSSLLAHAARTADPAMPVGLAECTCLPVASQVAELVVSFMVLMDVEDLDGTVREIARVLKPGGVLCAAILHPIFTSGLFVDGDPHQTFSMGEYSREMRHLFDVQLPVGRPLGLRVEHRPVERYSRAFEAAGLAITHVREPSPTDAAVEIRPEFAKFQRIPRFLHFRAQRLT